METLTASECSKAHGVVFLVFHSGKKMDLANCKDNLTEFCEGGEGGNPSQMD